MGKATAQGIQEQFERAGFAVTQPQPGRLQVSKSGFEASLELQPGGWIYPGPPYYVVKGIKCELEDRGYQKFWYSRGDGKRFPIRKVELVGLHNFDEEVRYLLGTKSLYNESLGSVNALTVYDRLTGRPDR